MQHLGEQWTELTGNHISPWDFFKEAVTSPARFLTHNVTGRGTTLDKVSKGLSTERFVEWLLRHETGHSVDEAIGWSNNNHFQNPACGGWQIFAAGGGEAAMVTEILNTCGINGGVLANLNAAFPGGNYGSMLNAVQHRRKQELEPAHRQASLVTFEGTNPGGRRLVDFAENVIHAGLSRPWEAGGAPAVGTRSYHRDTQHNQWVSYIHARYAQRNSNYQFQNPGEWFAEAYQSYFRGTPATWGQRLRDPIARAWFLANLVPVGNGGGGALINGVGDLTPVAGAAPAVVAPGAGTAAVPGAIASFAKSVAKLAVNVVKVPVDTAISAAMVPIKLTKHLPPVNWVLRRLGF